MRGKRQKSESAKIGANNANAERSVFYYQKFRPEWKSNPLLRDWLREDAQSRNRAYCAYCRCNLLSKYSGLLTHAKTKQHLKAAKLFKFEHEDEATTDIKDAPCIAKETDKQKIESHRKINARKCQKTGKYVSHSQGNKHKKENPQSNLKKRKLILDNMSDDDECVNGYSILNEDEQEISELVTNVDNDIFSNTSSGISKKLQAERIKAETEYFRQKALYFSKLSENSRVQRTLMIIQSRKLHLEEQKLQKEL